MTIAEVSQSFDITPDTLRDYERIGVIPPVPRTAGGIRDYDETSCEWIDLVKRLRSAGVRIDALIDYVSLLQEGEGAQEARKAILVEQRNQLTARIAEMQEALKRLNCKIDWYECCTVPAENRLMLMEARRKGAAK